jgi:hypothetical protein
VVVAEDYEGAAVWSTAGTTKGLKTHCSAGNDPPEMFATRGVTLFYPMFAVSFFVIDSL